MDYDEALELVGGCGRYQILIFILLGIVSMKAGIEIQSLVLTTYMPSYSCVQPYNSTNVKETVCFMPKNTTNMACTKWSFDNSEVDRTMMTEFNLTCSKEALGKIFMTVVMISIAVGRLIGLLCDIYGRRKIFIILVAYDLIMTPIQAFVPTLQAQFALRIMRGFGDGVVFTCWTYLMELVNNKYRMNIGSNYWLFFCFGYAGTGLVGNYVRDWRYVQVISCFVVPAYIAVCFLMVESPRWLVVKGDKQQAIKNLMTIARFNGKKYITYKKLQNVRVEEDTATGRLADCFSSRIMTMKTIIMAIIMFVSSFAYFGVALDAKFASQNIFINMLALGLIEIPCCPLAWILGDKLGRKWPTICFFAFSGIIILVVPHLPPFGPAAWVRTMIAIIGKLALTTGYALQGVFVMEMQPTCVRNVSLVPTVILTMLGGVLAPLVLLLFGVAYWLPSLLFGVTCIFGALSLLPLPETVNLPLAQTVEEANLLVRGQEKFFIARLNELRSINENDVLVQGQEAAEMIQNPLV